MQLNFSSLYFSVIVSAWLLESTVQDLAFVKIAKINPKIQLCKLARRLSLANHLHLFLKLYKILMRLLKLSSEN